MNLCFQGGCAVLQVALLCQVIPHFSHTLWQCTQQQHCDNECMLWPSTKRPIRPFHHSRVQTNTRQAQQSSCSSMLKFLRLKNGEQPGRCVRSLFLNGSMASSPGKSNGLRLIPQGGRLHSRTIMHPKNNANNMAYTKAAFAPARAIPLPHNTARQTTV